MSKSKRYGGASRKTRSIGLTCERICSRFPLYIENGESWEVSVDSVVRTLNASKGSVYEIFHVLEGILVVSKIGTKVYRWNGFQPLRTVLSFLQVIGRDCMGMEAKMRRVKLHELSNLVERSKVKSESLLPGAENSVEPQESVSIYLNEEGEEELSSNNIHILEACQQFVMIFLLAPEPKIITLEYAAKIIYGMNLSVQGVQSRTRRLCDMANVLTSLPIPFIEKVQVSGPSGRRTAFKYNGPSIPSNAPLDENEILKLPDYRRKHLLFSKGKKWLCIPERPEKMSGTVTLRRCVVTDEQGLEYSVILPNNGLDLDRLILENWRNLSIDDVIEIEKHRIRFPAIQPIRKRTLFKNQRGEEVDLDLIIHPRGAF